HQSVLRLALIILAPRPLGLIPRPLQAELPLVLDLGLFALELRAEQQERLDLGRPNDREEGLGDRAIDVSDRQALAHRRAVALLAAPAHVAGARRTVVRLHPTPAASTVDDPLEQRGPWPGRSPTRLELAAVVAKPRPVGQVPLPTQIGGMMIGQEDFQRVEGE